MKTCLILLHAKNVHIYLVQKSSSLPEIYPYGNLANFQGGQNSLVMCICLSLSLQTTRFDQDIIY